MTAARQARLAVLQHIRWQRQRAKAEQETNPFLSNFFDSAAFSAWRTYLALKSHRAFQS